MGILPNFFSKGSKFGQKWQFLDVLNTGKYRRIGIWSPEYRYSGIGIYRIGNTICCIVACVLCLFIYAIENQFQNARHSLHSYNLSSTFIMLLI
jgi:hypothetical protein